MEFWRPPATATIVVFPILNSSGVQTSGASSLDSEFVAWSDGTGPGNGNNFADMAGETTEIGATGVYQLAVAAAELPAASPYVAIQIKSSLATQFLLINTATQYVDLHRWRGTQPLALTAQRVDVTVGAMQNSVITAAAHAAGAIDAAAIAANAIGSSEIADGALDSGAFAAGVLPTNFGSQVINASGYVFVGQIATYAVAATSFADNAITAAKVNVDVGSEFADALLKRNVASGSTGGREVREAFALLRNKVTIEAGTMTVNDTDDATALFTAAVATVSYNAQVVSIDP